MAKSYKDAGVDIDAGNEFVRKIIPIVKSTYRPDVLAGVGGFAAHLHLNLGGIKEPVLVSSTDGVGTKLKIAQELNRYDTIGIDLVAMCVNDIACSGAKPLFFLDYFAVESLKPDEHSRIIKGIAEGCKTAGCSLVGGETAELPGIYQKGDFDLAGFAVGIVDRDKIVDGSSVAIGDTIIGIASSGIHSNGYSLVRKICEDAKLNLSDPIDGSGRPLGEILLTPTRIYSTVIQKLTPEFDLLGIAHITGGGIIENLPRILPKSCRAQVSVNSWERPRIFDLLQKWGGVEEQEMQRVFNLGIGMAVVVHADQSIDVCERIRALGEPAVVIGEIVERKDSEPQIVLE